MADAERDPSVLVSARLADHPKLLHLPSDAARWGWMVVLGRAKLRRPAGEFPSRTVLAHDLGRYARFIPDYLTVGLLEDRGGLLVVHDWPKHQGRRSEEPLTGAERTARWRDSQRDANVTSSDVSGDDTVTAPSRARASALSPSQSQSPLHPERNGTAVPAQDEPESAALGYLASVGAAVAPDGNGIHRKLVDLVRRRGLDAVMAGLRELHTADPSASGRQLVFSVENALDRPQLAATSPKGYHAQGDPSLAFRRR